MKGINIKFGDICIVIVSIIMAFVLNGKNQFYALNMVGFVVLVDYYRNKGSKFSIIKPFSIFFIVKFIIFMSEGLEVLKFLAFLKYIFIVMIYLIPFFLDNLFYPKVDGLKKIFILPLFAVCVEYIISVIAPFGTSGSIVYTQGENTILLQLLSVSGVYGTSFLIYFIISFLQWILSDESYDNKKWIILICAIVIPIFCWNNHRLISQLREDEKRILLSTIHVDNKSNKQFIDKAILDGKVNKSEIKTICDKSENSMYNLIFDEQRNRVKIIITSNESVFVLKQDEYDFLKKLQSISNNLNVDICISFKVIDLNEKKSNTKVTFISKNCNKNEIYEEEYSYLTKKRTVILKNFGIIETRDLRLTVWVDEYTTKPKLMRKNSVGNADLLCIITKADNNLQPYKSYTSLFRGIENGCNVVQAAEDEKSFVAYYTGKELKEKYITNTEGMRCSIPIRGKQTVYNKLGDWSALICFLFLINFLLAEYTPFSKGKVNLEK